MDTENSTASQAAWTRERWIAARIASLKAQGSPGKPAGLAMQAELEWQIDVVDQRGHPRDPDESVWTPHVQAEREAAGKYAGKPRSPSPSTASPKPQPAAQPGNPGDGWATDPDPVAEEQRRQEEEWTRLEAARAQAEQAARPRGERGEQRKSGRNKRADAADIGQESTRRGVKNLKVGSDLEIAERVAADLKAKFGEVVYDDGDFYVFDQRAWIPIEDRELKKSIFAYDGALYPTPSESISSVLISNPKLKSIIELLRDVLMKRNFFLDVRPGINCANGFIFFDERGNAALLPHSQDHRQRHVLPGKWNGSGSNGLISGSLLQKLLNGTFLSDPDIESRVQLIAEILGAAATGCATKITDPLAFVFSGVSAENGKSQILELARGLLPESAIASVPAAKMRDEKHVFTLKGKLLNACDELSANAIASDVFKTIVTGNPVSARDVYRSAVQFRSVALHVFSTQFLPRFTGGMDKGVRRRLCVIEFTRTIPREERIANIGLRIGGEEPDNLLSFAVWGASRLIRQGRYTLPPSTEKSLRHWITGADCVEDFAENFVSPLTLVVTGSRPSGMRSSVVYRLFRNWALAEGYAVADIPANKGFSERLREAVPGLFIHRSNGSWLCGVTIRNPETGGILAAEAVA